MMKIDRLESKVLKPLSDYDTFCRKAKVCRSLSKINYQVLLTISIHL